MMDRRGPSHSAPYGQACLHCFKSKCKCVPRPGGNGCERSAFLFYDLLLLRLYLNSLLKTCLDVIV